jgi:uracil-DNA glycosylase family 4
MNKDLKKIIKQYRDCDACSLHEQARTHVFFRGDCPCDVLFIGEAPGKDEDLIGQPFIGRAGDILDELIKDSGHELHWSDVNQGDYTFGITNIVCCIPWKADHSGVRAPSDKEAKACSPRLVKTILAANPKLIVLLGLSASKNYQIPESLSHVPILELQHPAYIGYNGGVGSMTYDTNLVRLVSGLEKHLYGEAKDQKRKVKKRPKGKVILSKTPEGKVRRKKAKRKKVRKLNG